MVRYYKKRRRQLYHGQRGRRYNNSSLPPERKFLDMYHAASVPPIGVACTGGEMQPASPTGCLSCPAIGDDASSRDGKHIIIQSLEIKGMVYSGALANQTAKLEKAALFIAVVLDTQTNGNTINSEDVFKNIAGVDLFNSIPHRNPMFGKRFKVLKTWHFNVIPGNTAYDGTNMETDGTYLSFEWYKKMRLAVNMNAGTSADVANVIDNSIHVIAFQRFSQLNFGYTARIRFIG